MQIQLLSQNTIKNIQAEKIQTYVEHKENIKIEGGAIEILPNHENMILSIKDTYVNIFQKNESQLNFIVNNCVIKIENNVIMIISDYIINRKNKEYAPFTKIPEHLEEILKSSN